MGAKEKAWKERQRRDQKSAQDGHADQSGRGVRGNGGSGQADTSPTMQHGVSPQGGGHGNGGKKGFHSHGHGGQHNGGK